MEVTVFTEWIYDHFIPMPRGAGGSASGDAAGHCGRDSELAVRLVGTPAYYARGRVASFWSSV